MQEDSYIPTTTTQTNVLRTRIPKVPPTPAPKTKDTIMNDARDRFAGILWIQKDENRDIEDYFIDYDYWEEYSESKSYSKRIYQAAYKGVMREYHNYLCVLNTEQGEDYYVIAKRVHNELESLQEYCTCSRCIALPINPMKYIWCPHCTNCIQSGIGFAKQEYIDRAKQLKIQAEKKKQIPNKYSAYVGNLNNIKATEYIVLGIISLVILYKWVI